MEVEAARGAPVVHGEPGAEHGGLATCRATPQHPAPQHRAEPGLRRRVRARSGRDRGPRRCRARARTLPAASRPVQWNSLQFARWPTSCRSTSPRARRRRERAIAAALELASEGGYEAVQMRDVAQRADIALGTLYRYFSGKDHLLAAAQVEWVEALEARVGTKPPRVRRPPIDSSTCCDAPRAMEREPKLSAALVTAMSGSDPQVAECQQDIAQSMLRIQLQAFPDGFDEALASEIARVLGHVWYSSLVGWVNGWLGITEAGDELDLAAHLLLDQYG
ncbi:MAG: TetR family transcriptional regulator [Acidimicrobiales bacterium]